MWTDRNPALRRALLAAEQYLPVAATVKIGCTRATRKENKAERNARNSNDR